MRADGIPSKVQIARSDNGGGGGVRGYVRKVCTDLSIKEVCTPAHIPPFGGIADRELGIIKAVAMVAKIRAGVILSHVQLPDTGPLWAEVMRRVCEAFNRTACAAKFRQQVAVRDVARIAGTKLHWGACGRS